MFISHNCTRFAMVLTISWEQQNHQQRNPTTTKILANFQEIKSPAKLREFLISTEKISSPIEVPSTKPVANETNMEYISMTILRKTPFQYSNYIAVQSIVDGNFLFNFLSILLIGTARTVNSNFRTAWLNFLPKFCSWHVLNRTEWTAKYQFFFKFFETTHSIII